MTIITSNKKILYFYYIILFVLILDSLRVWFFWKLPFVIPVLFLLISLGVYNLIPNLFSFNRTTINIIFLYILAVFGATRGNLNAYLGSAINVMIFAFFAGLKDIYKKEFLTFFTKVFSILIGISLFGWILFLLGVDLPNSVFTFGNLDGKVQYSFMNYYIFLSLNNSEMLNIAIARFSSVFLEPGYLGIILVILLYLNNFNLKNKYNRILLIALIFTFSLAGWLIGFVAYIAVAIKNRKNKIWILLSIVICSIALYSFFSLYNDGNNIVNEAILSRLKYDDSTGAITGYNRTSVAFDDWFERYFLKSSNIYLGLGVDVPNIVADPGTGWKVFFAYYGLLGLILYLIFLLHLPLKDKNYFSYVLFFLYVAIFIRGHYDIFWSAFPILYLCKMSNNRIITHLKNIPKIRFSKNS